MVTAKGERKVTVQLLTSPGCAFCANAERLLDSVKSKLAAIEVEKVNIKEHPEIIERHGLLSTPAILINGKLEFNRTPDEKTLTDRIQKALQVARGVNVGEAVFQVRNIHCEGCRFTLEAGLKLRPGVLDASADREKQEVRVWYDPSATSWQKLRSHMKWSGFIVRKLRQA